MFLTPGRTIRAQCLGGLEVAEAAMTVSSARCEDIFTLTSVSGKARVVFETECPLKFRTFSETRLPVLQCNV